MSHICQITGKHPKAGRIIHRKGGTHVTAKTKRLFKPNTQRIRVRLPSGQVKRMNVSVKAIKAGLVTKA